MCDDRSVNVEVDEAGPLDWECLSALFELYTYDFSEVVDIDVGDDGRFRTPPLDGYFTDPSWHAFLVRSDGKLAGFALVQERSRLTGDESVRDMTEFFVLRKYRRQGVGARVATWLFDRFRGRWEVREKPDNHAATAFWRRVIATYTAGRFEEEQLESKDWQGPVQRFDSADRA